MKKIIFIFCILFLTTSIQVNAVALADSSYLGDITKHKIIVGVENENSNKFIAYLRNNFKLNVEVKNVNSKEGLSNLLSKKIDFLDTTLVDFSNKNIKYINNFTLNSLGVIGPLKHKYNKEQIYHHKLGN